jgi:transposase
MTSMTLSRGDVIVGVDTHKDEHVGVTVDGIGGRLDELFVPATNAGYEQLLDWAREQGRVVAFGVEGTGSYGIGLARFLRRHGIKVIEVSRPPRKGERRAAGKSDTVDAEHAARQVLSGEATASQDLRRRHRGAAPGQDRPRYGRQGPHGSDDHVEGHPGHRLR